MSKNVPSISIVLLALLLASACSGPAQQVVSPTVPLQTEPVQMPNPASENCVEQGGTLTIQERGDGGQYGVCVFEDNRQCEEWALLRGDCPAGGLKITGFITPAAQYCVITGGTYTITGNSGMDDEQGTCTLPSGLVCDAWGYYNGECS